MNTGPLDWDAMLGAPKAPAARVFIRLNLPADASLRPSLSACAASARSCLYVHLLTNAVDTDLPVRAVGPAVAAKYRDLLVTSQIRGGG